MTERTYGGYTAAELRALCDDVYALRSIDAGEVISVNDETADLYLAARTALPDLLDRIAALEAALRQVVDVLTATAHRSTGYDWNADYDYMTLRQSEAFAAARAALGDHDDR